MEENIMKFINKIGKTTILKEDKEFEEKFGRNAYIAEPNGTKNRLLKQ